MLALPVFEVADRSCATPAFSLFASCCMYSGLGSLINGVSLKTRQNSPIFCMLPPFPVYKVRRPLHKEAYPLVSLQMSPCWIHAPASSQTEILIDPDRSATLHVLTSWPSLVLIGLPMSNTMNVMVRFFIPGFSCPIVGSMAGESLY